MKESKLIGKEIMIINMKDEPQYAGKKGVVTHVDDLGQIHGTWGGCAIIPTEDLYIVFNDSKDHKENAGYKIIEVITMPEEDYVLGVKESDGELKYVTWMCVDDTYYHGHYINDYHQARYDLYERAERSLFHLVEKFKNYGGNNE